MSNSGPSGIHPVLTLINRCDELARNFDSTFEQSCILLTNLANNAPAPGQPTTMDDTLMSLRKTLEKCEEIVGAMLNCIYEDIPHLLDQLDSGENVGVGNWNPKQALDGISQLFYVSDPALTLPYTPQREKKLTTSGVKTVISRVVAGEEGVVGRFHLRRDRRCHFCQRLDSDRWKSCVPEETAG